MSYAAIYKLLRTGQVDQVLALCQREVQRELMEAWETGQIQLPSESAISEALVKASHSTAEAFEKLSLNDQAPGKPCIKCGKPATVSAWFAKSY